MNTILKKHKENVLFDREVAMLPATQTEVERMIHIKELQDQYNKMRQEMIKLRSAMNLVCTSIRAVSSGTISRENEKKFVQACPGENCKGFLDSKWHCGLCSSNVCSECFAIKPTDKDHVCDPNDVETAKTIRKDSKPCPSCGTFIFKIDGCSQIWCTSCKTAFDWRTGAIETKNIHNPHYYEWLRQMQKKGENVPREYGDVRCGGLPALWQINKLKNTELLNIYRVLSHVVHVEMLSYRVPRVVNALDVNRHLRIKYMMNTISKEQFKVSLQRSEKNNKRKLAIYQVLEMFHDVGSEYMRAVVEDRTKCNSIISQFTSIREYFNDHLRKVSKRFNCVVPYIDDTWNITKVSL